MATYNGPWTTVTLLFACMMRITRIGAGATMPRLDKYSE
jgi:hypothetical protein